MKRLQIALFVIIVCISNESMRVNSTCKEVEKNALLKFKHSFFADGSNVLGSWIGDDCCSWKRVGCDNVTNNVIKLNMSTMALYGQNAFYFLEPHEEKHLQAKEVSPALLELKYLTYLDLSGIDFNGSDIPEFFGSMKQLQHLNLSRAFFGGKFPYTLANLKNLVVLDLRFSLFWARNVEKINNLKWAFELENLQYLDLSGMDLSQALDSLHILHKLPSLKVLKLEFCYLGNSHLVVKNPNVSSIKLQNLNLGNNQFRGTFPHFIQNLSSLRFLDLSWNGLTSSPPSWLGSLVNLTHVDFEWNHIHGSFPSFIQNLSFISFLSLSNNQFTSSIPHWLANKTNLEYLSLSSNHFDSVHGGLLNTISHLCRLKFLDLSNNPLQEEVLNSHVELSRCSTYDLESLYLEDNNFSGDLSSIGNFSSLRNLDLSRNNFENIPPSLERFSCLITLSLSDNHLKVVFPSIGNLSSLEELYLSNNNLENIPSSLGGLSSLKILDLSQNTLETLPPSLWTLPSLTYLELANNRLSIVNQVSLANISSLKHLDLSLNSLILDFSSDWLPPFQLETLNLLSCEMNSPFPKWILSQENIEELDLSNTGIFGTLPNNIGNVMSSLSSLRLSDNHIIGSIPRSLCELANLDILDLKNNSLSGIIPDCWTKSTIIAMKLSSNKLFGHIPNSLTTSGQLQLLSLNSNSLQGKLPLSLGNCPDLIVLDVGMNNLHGEIPTWSGATYESMKILILRGNRFKGVIPPQLCSIHTLQVIDLASNSLSGTIPRCFGYFKGMDSDSNGSSFSGAPTVNPEWGAMEVIKGEEREYTTILHLLVNMDLSSNNLVGTIPTKITTSTRLLGLNFSHNHLNGTIPKEIGRMHSLESFDLSCNNISGSIPESISSLTFLSTMNLSFNNLQGKIPTSTQLGSFNDSSYMGNPGLCGDPLPKKCFGDDIAPPQTSKILEDEDNNHEKMWFYLVIISGFATGFWAVIGSLVVIKRWRHAYFQFADNLADWIYVRVALKIARAK